jgi:hypothetical protein
MPLTFNRQRMATRRPFGIGIHERKPCVVALNFHLVYANMVIAYLGFVILMAMEIENNWLTKTMEYTKKELYSLCPKIYVRQHKNLHGF